MIASMGHQSCFVRSQKFLGGQPGTALYTIYIWLYSPCEPWPLYQFLSLYTQSVYTVGNDQVKEDEMGRSCSTNGGEEECI
jgi:hypothetical protein